jgi:hypothetical protein
MSSPSQSNHHGITDETQRHSRSNRKTKKYKKEKAMEQAIAKMTSQEKSKF